MNRSESIVKISAALVKAQSEMSNAKKGASNPFFKSKYADLNSIREAALPVLNAHGITVIQPTCVVDGVNYVETILLHESGEYISSLTQIVVDKVTDAQKHGSGLSYARRYALQSIVCLGAEDDDANAAVQAPKVSIEEEKQKALRDFNVCKSIVEVTALWNKLPAHVRAIPEVVEACKTKGESFKVTKPAPNDATK
jgi:hypothetical protein